MTEYRALTEEVNGIIRWLNILPAWDKRSAESRKNYGIHGLELLFGVQRGKFAVTWRIMTDWMLKAAQQEFDQRRLPHIPRFGLGSLDYHSPVIQYKGQVPIANCQFTDGDCYCGSTYVGAEELWHRMVAEGPNPVWEKLEEWLKNCEAKANAEDSNNRNFS